MNNDSDINSKEKKDNILDISNNVILSTPVLLSIYLRKLARLKGILRWNPSKKLVRFLKKSFFCLNRSGPETTSGWSKSRFFLLFEKFK